MDTTALNNLKAWFLDQQRDFPWRDNPTPYSVWVSEVMLQQTQASVVVPYFLRWMRLFPSIQDLARAPLDHVIKEWEGLGYYSRARNLHQGAQYVMENHNGQLPDSIEALKKIKGLGPYTIGAILSFAFHKRIEAVDGNVIRVIARYYGIQEDISQGSTLKRIRAHAADLLPEKESWIVNEALIELGATLCGRRPKCVECPIKANCKAYSLGIAAALPVKSAKPATTQLHRSVAVIRHCDSLLVRRGPKGGIMSDLYEFPYFEVEDPAGINPKNLEQYLLHNYGIKASWNQSLPQVRHSFTRYRASLYPQIFSVSNTSPVPDYEWMSISTLKKLAFSSGHRRIFASVS